MESTSQFVEIDGSIVNSSGPNDYREVALTKAKDKILLQNGFFYFEAEIVTKGNKDDGIIGVGFCTKPKDLNTISNHMPGQDDDSWGYHDDGYFFSSKNGRPYGPSYTTGDIIGCYLNFKNRKVYYTKNGVNIGIACHLPKDLPKDLENSMKILYPCIGLRSQGGSIEVNFGIGGRKFKYSAMNNDDIGEELYGENCLDILYNSGLIYFLDQEPNDEFALMYRGKGHLIMQMYNEALEDFTKVLENEQNNLLALTYRGKAYFIIGEYEKAFADLTKVLESEPENIIARRYRGEINQMKERYYESSDDLKELLKINPNDVWAVNARELVEKTFLDSTIEAFRLDRLDYSLDLIIALVKKGRLIEKKPETLRNFQEDLVNFGLMHGFFLFSNGSMRPYSSLDVIVKNLPDLSNNLQFLMDMIDKFVPRSEKIVNDTQFDHDRNFSYFEEHHDILRVLGDEIQSLLSENPLSVLDNNSTSISRNIVQLIIQSHLPSVSRSLRRELEIPKENRSQKEFGNWTSNNPAIDKFIQQVQLEAENISQIIEWIPFKSFTNIKYLAEGGFGTVFKAVWKDGYIVGFDIENGKWKRAPQITVCLKSLHGSKDIKKEFLEEVKNQHKHGGKSAIAIYGLTKGPNDDEYMIVMQYAKQGSLRKLLDRKFYQLTWMNKIENLLYIAEGLHAIHKDGLVHKDLHSGNIVNEGTTSSYITDFGLCRPVSQDSSSTELFGVLPYIAPEVLNKGNKEYTPKSDIYSYGIIMSEIFNGYPPYYNFSHDITLASEIFNGRRPNIRRSVPELLLDLMKMCLDTKPQERPDAKDLVDKLKQYRQDLTHKGELHRQIEKIKQVEGINNIDNSPTYNKQELSYQIHEQAIYTSKSLNSKKSSKLVNTSNAVHNNANIDFTVGSDDLLFYRPI